MLTVAYHILRDSGKDLGPEHFTSRNKNTPRASQVAAGRSWIVGRQPSLDRAGIQSGAAALRSMGSA